MLTLLILLTLIVGSMVVAAWRTTTTRQAQRAARLRYLAYRHRATPCHEREFPCWRHEAQREERY